MTVETVIRNIERLRAAAGGGSKLKFRIRFSSQGHERRGLHPSYFGLQLKRWHDRAGDVDLRFGIEVESMAQRYSEISGLDVAWVPWPNEATNCAPFTGTINPAAPHIYIYASRREQGTGDAEHIVQGLQSALPRGARYTVQIGAYKHPAKFKTDKLKDLGKITSEAYPDSLTRFIQNEFSTLNVAEKNRQKLIARGLKDAWIIAFIGGKRYTLEDLIMVDFLGRPIN